MSRRRSGCARWRAGPTTCRRCSTSRRPSAWSPTSTRWSPATRAASRWPTCSGDWSFRHLDLAVDRRVLIPRPETEVVAGVAIDLARDSAPRPGHRGRPRHRIGRDRTVAGRRAAGRRGDGVAHRRQCRRPRRGAGEPGRHRAAAPPTSAIADRPWFDALPAGTRARRRGVEPAVRRRGVAARRRVGAPAGSRTTRCSPGPTVSTTSGRSSPRGAGLGPTRRVARARDRRRPGHRGRRAASLTAGYVDESRSAPTSPAATASPSAGSKGAGGCRLRSPLW